MKTSVDTTTNAEIPKRLLSLDILRGLDLACLVLIQPIIYEWLLIRKPAESTIGAWVIGQVTHVPWKGLDRKSVV